MSRIVGSDEMFTHFQFEAPAAERVESMISFREVLEFRLTYLENYFTSRGWPAFRPRVLVVSEAWDGWERIPDEWEARFAANGVDPRLETFPPSPPGMEIGLNFISRRMKRLGEESWAIVEARRILAVLDAKDMDEATEAAHALGELHEQQHRHVKDLPAVRRNAKQIASFSKKAVEHGEFRRDQALLWQARAVELAREYIERHPRASRSEVAKRVRRILAQENMTSADGTTPSERTVRRAIQGLTP